MSTTQLTREVIDARVSAGELLVIVYDKVYDLTRWKNNHPGGELILKHLAGKDATDATVAFHPEWVWLKKMPLFLIGELKTKESKVNKISQSYRKLNEELKAAGLFVSDYWFYFREVVKFVILWATMIYFILYGSSNIHYFISATSAGILWHQAAFFAHDGFESF
jgi:cytochrome b involved in lipid metabolism